MVAGRRSPVRNRTPPDPTPAGAHDILAGMAEPIEETLQYRNGNVKHHGWYLEGQMHGEWSFFRTDGSLMRAGRFEHGRQVGVWRTLDRSGRVVKETDFGG
jgi:antitoxin component YwqK of YwqJK toxin-antitoxin module